MEINDQNVNSSSMVYLINIILLNLYSKLIILNCPTDNQSGEIKIINII